MGSRNNALETGWDRRRAYRAQEAKWVKYQRRYREANRGKLLEKSLRYYQDNKRGTAETHKEKWLEYRRRRRAAATA
jgi:hypothetical protein